MVNVRQTSEDIDRAIIDIAASLFAKHGYAGTSLAQVAAAVGYSKAGLINRYGSKEGLYRAIIDLGLAISDELIEIVDQQPRGRDRDRYALTLAMDQAFEHVGIMQMMINAFEPDSDLPFIVELQVQSLRIIIMLEVSLETPADALRVILALQLVVNAVTVQTLRTPFDLTMPREELTAHTVDLALHTLHAPVAPPA